MPSYRLRMDCSLSAWQKLNQSGGLPLHPVRSVIKRILIIAAVTLTTGNLAYASHSGAECYHNGHRLYVPDGLNYPRQAWASWGISCRTPPTGNPPRSRRKRDHTGHPL